MELDLKKLVPAGIVLLVLAFVAGRYGTPERVVTKTETQIVEKEVVKTVEKKVRDQKNDKVTLITETVSPDGTKKREVKIVDKSEITNYSDKNTEKQSETSVTQKTETTRESKSLGWNVSALGSMSHSKDDLLGNSVSFGVHVQRRVLGPFSVGVFGLTNQTYGLSVGGSF